MLLGICLGGMLFCSCQEGNVGWVVLERECWLGRDHWFGSVREKMLIEILLGGNAGSVMSGWNSKTGWNCSGIEGRFGCKEEEMLVLFCQGENTHWDLLVKEFWFSSVREGMVVCFVRERILIRFC